MIQDKFDLSDRPTDSWICEVCGALNSNWQLSLKWFLDSDNVTSKYVHGDCDNCRKIKEEELARQIMIKRRLDNKMRSEYLYKCSNLPLSLRNIRFEDLDIREGAEEAFRLMKLLNEQSSWLYIYGDNSVGKSYLIGATINDLVSRLIPVMYINESQFFDSIRFSWDSKFSDSEKEIFDKLYQANIIIWDEFLLLNYLESKSTLWKYERLYSIVEHCSENNKVMVFASNVRPYGSGSNGYRRLEERAGKRIVARMIRNDTRFVEMSNKPFYG